MEPVGVIEILRKVFTFEDATNTYSDIVRYLNKIRVKETTYSKWGRNASQPTDPKEGKNYETAN